MEEENSILNPTGAGGMRTKIGERQEFPNYDKATLPKNAIKSKLLINPSFYESDLFP